MKIEKTTPEYDNYAVIDLGEHIGNIHNRAPAKGFLFQPAEGGLYTAAQLHHLANHLEELNKTPEAAEAALRG